MLNSHYFFALYFIFGFNFSILLSLLTRDPLTDPHYLFIFLLSSVKYFTMKRKVLLFLIITTVSFYCISCARGISTYEAANGKARCGRYIR